MKPARPNAPAWRDIRRRFRLLALAAATCFCTWGRAGELVDARFELKPPQPYVGQPFEMHLFVEVSSGSELQDLSLTDAGYDDVALVQSFRTLERKQTRHDDRTVDLLHYVASGRVLKPVQRQLAGVLRATVVERRTLGFFSSWSSSSAAVRMHPLALQFRALPVTGVPAGFQGAVGSFVFTVRATPREVSPGDLVNLDYTVSGSGWLGQAQLVLPPAGDGFRSYPPQEVQRDEGGRLSVRRVVIPLTTNATMIAAARFPYFDPIAGAYREALAGPMTLRVTTTPVSPGAPAVKRVDIEPARESPADGTASMLQISSTITQARRLMPFAVALLSAVLVAGLLAVWRPRLAAVAGVVVFAAVFVGMHHAMVSARPVTARIRTSVPAHLCPAAPSQVLFHLAAGGQVSLLETASGWVRVDAAGRRGWIQATALETASVGTR